MSSLSSPHKQAEIYEDPVLDTGNGNSTFSELYRQNFPLLVSYFSRKFSQEESEDLAQATFVKALKHAEGYAHESSQFRTWVFAIAQNVLIDHLRRITLPDNRTLRVLYSSDLYSVPTITNEAIFRVIQGECYDEIQNLPLGQRKAMELLLQGYAYGEIAVQLGIAVGTVKNYIHFARKKLRKILK